MVSNILKLSICAVSFAVMGTLGQQSVWAFSNTSLLENSSQAADTSNSAENNLLLRNVRNIEVMNSKPEIADYYTPSFIPESSSAVSAAQLSTYIPPYSNRWANLSTASPRPRKVPEPSAVLGLMAIASWLGMQQKFKKG